MAEYIVSAEAEADLDGVWDFSMARFGLAQAEKYQRELHYQFQLVADFPGIGGSRLLIPDKDYYRLPFASHVIVYSMQKCGVRIERVFYARMDYWQFL